MSYLPLWGNLRDLNLASILFRFALAALCSGLIGLERGRKQHAAGLRTHLLVCIGAASVMITSQYLSLYFNTGDPARLGAQVISGIGFLGAGTIIVTGRNQVRGLTTAAGLWASACMGLAIGSGFYEGAIIMCILLYIVLVSLNRLDDNYIKSGSSMLLYVEYDQEEARFSDILRQLRSTGCHVDGIVQMSQSGAIAGVQLQVIMKKSYTREKSTIVAQIGEIPGVLFAEEL